MNKIKENCFNEWLVSMIPERILYFDSSDSNQKKKLRILNHLKNNPTDINSKIALEELLNN